MNAIPSRADLKPGFFFGTVTVTGHIYPTTKQVGPRTYKKDVIACRCVCGKEFIASVALIVRGDSRTCGSYACTRVTRANQPWTNNPYPSPSAARRIGQQRGAFKTKQNGKTGRPAPTPERVPSWKAWTATPPPPALTAAERCAQRVSPHVLARVLAAEAA